MTLPRELAASMVVMLCMILPGEPAVAQRAELRPASPILLPGTSDSNSPVQWREGNFTVFQSMGLPLIVTGESQTATLRARPVLLNSFAHYPLWIESTWTDDDGTMYAWYHHESWVCSPLAVPSIGALVSYDGGYSFQDLGIVLESGYPADCAAQNGFFAGGHGDFTVLLDSRREYFYFYFTNYSGPLPSQGVGVARMRFADRLRPVGRVSKFYQNSWSEPGLRGRLTAVLPARVSWASSNTDSFWGPSLHRNIYLNQYVMLLNRSCCAPGWPQEGIYVAFNPDLADPWGWSAPAQILAAPEAKWYPQVIGIRPGRSDKEAGRVARFYMAGDSYWNIVFEP